MFLQRLAQALENENVRYALVGGYAVALHGAVRGTVDIDLVLALNRQQFVKLEKAVATLGLKSHLPVTAEEVFDFREEYIARRNLIAWNFVNASNPTEVVDVIITHDVNAMETVDMKFGEISIPVVTIDELIKMKKASARPQDLEDVAALEKLR